MCSCNFSFGSLESCCRRPPGSEQPWATEVPGNTTDMEKPAPVSGTDWETDRQAIHLPEAPLVATHSTQAFSHF